MNGRGIFRQPSRPLQVLCIGAHSDDIEIGCGGTILKLLRDRPRCNVMWVVLSARGTRKQEALRSARDFLARAGSKTIVTKAFKESFFPHCGDAVKTYFERLKRTIDPDVIFTHCRHDLHQDHRVVCELTWNTFRRHQILEYEIPKYDGDLGQPNVYVSLADDVADEKVRLLMRGFGTQRSRQWFTDDTFYALLRLRGIEANAAGRHAEAFYGRKLILE